MAADGDSTQAPDPTAKALLAVPAVAWSTIALAVTTLAVWVAALASIALNLLPLPASMAIATVAAYVSFTPMHDASHRSVARSSLVNAIVGRACALPLLALFSAFRYLHLEHHKFTNEPDRDPDHWVARGPTWQHPLRWLTMELPYLLTYRRRTKVASRGERLEMAISSLLSTSLLVAPLFFGHWRAVLFGWVIPAKIAGVFLAYAFDYLPHRPHTITSRVDRFRATIVHSAAWRTPILLWQNYHLIHHLYPAVPFYRYGRVWRAQREMLLANGAVDRSRP